MTRLNTRQRHALSTMMSCPHRYEMAGTFRYGIGRGTLDGLVDAGLAERGPDRQGNVGYAITDAGREALR
jgi:DNA-binding PadR family transcriptional regulator